MAAEERTCCHSQVGKQHETNCPNRWVQATMPGMEQMQESAGPQAPVEQVQHPSHYGGDTVYEVIKVLRAWGLHKDAYLFNVVKYVARAGRKGDAVTDLKKARFYLDEAIKELES